MSGDKPRKDKGRIRTTGRAVEGARQVAIRLSAEEYARALAKAGDGTVTAWCTEVVVGAANRGTVEP